MGISFFTGGFQYSILEKADDNISFVERAKCTNPAPGRIRESSEWIYSTLEEISTRHTLKRIGFKLHYDLTTMKALYAHGAPVGVLGYFCAEKNIPLEGFTARKIKSYRFLNLPKKSQTFDWLDSNHRDTGPYWDDNARYSFAVAFRRASEA